MKTDSGDKIGDLMFDSPGVWDLIQRSIEISFHAEILSAYTLACRHGALSEWPVKREVGVSYNPRPARLMHILLQEAKERNGVIIAAAPLTCAENLSTISIDSLSDQLRPSFELAQEVADEVCLPSQNVTRLVLSKLIDDIRHLHMTHFTASEQREYATRTQQKLLTLPEASKEERLSSLLVAALERTLRREVHRS